jgi:deoxyribonuclease-4
MYEAEIALLRGDAEERFGGEFLDAVERLHHFFDKRGIAPREFVLSTWEQLKTDAKAKKADPREPMERLYDLIVEHQVIPGEWSEEALNHRLTAWLAGKDWLKSA